MNIFFLGCCERMRTCSLVITWNHNCCGIWGMKFIVRNMVSRNITVLNILSSWSAAHPRKIFVLTLQSFPWVGVNVQCPCFSPLLPGGQAITWRYFPSLYHADAPLHKRTIFFEQLEEGEKLWDVKGCCARGSPFSCEVPPCFSSDIQTLKTVKCKCPHWSDWLWWGHPYDWTPWALWGCMEDHGLAEMILCLVKSMFSPQGACGAASCWLAGSSRHASKQIPALG